MKSTKSVYHEKRKLQRPGWRSVPFAAVVLAMIILGNLFGKIIFSAVLLAGIAMHLFDLRSRLELDDTHLRVRTWAWSTVPYANIAAVKRYELRTYKGWLGSISKVTAKLPPYISKSSLPTVRIDLKRRQWTVVLVPIPLVLWRRFDVFYIAEADVDRFIEEVSQRISVTNY